MKVFKSLQNRRASRRGYSLELHVARLLSDHGIPFDAQVETEPGNVADFILPSHRAYIDLEHPVGQLHHLAAKSTVRERWRQMLEEARRVATKHLITLDSGISQKTRDAMASAGIVLVMPSVLADPYADARIRSLEQFFSDL